MQLQQHIFFSRKGDRRPSHHLGQGRFFSPHRLSSLRVRPSKGALRHLWETGVWRGASQQTPRAALGRRWDGPGEREAATAASSSSLPACQPSPPTPIDWQTWPAIGGPPPGPAPSPAPSGGPFLRPAGSPLAPVGGSSATVGRGWWFPDPAPILPALPPNQARSLGSETETPGPSRWSYHGGPRHRGGRQTQSLPTPQRRRGPVRQARFLEPSPRSTSASGKPRPGPQGSVAPSERARAHAAPPPA